METSRSNRKRVAAIAALALAIGSGAYLLLSPAAQQNVAEQTDSDPGQVTDAQMQRLGIKLEPARLAQNMPLGVVPGTVTLPPESRVAVTVPFAGTAVRIFVLQGQQVTKGQPLATVRAADTVRFGAELARAEADLAVARGNANRLEVLAREGVIAEARAEEARALAIRAEQTLRENHRLLSLAGAGADGTITLRAPIAGRVSTVAVQTGGAVGDGTAPFVVENASAFTLDLQLPSRLAGQVRPGMMVEVDSAGTMIAGQVLSVGGTIDPATNSLPAKARIDNAPALVPGKGIMAVVYGDGASQQSGVVVPSSAVVRIGGQDFAFVRKSGRFERRPVTVVAQAGGRTVLSGGVAVNEPVAITGVAELKSLLAGE